MSMQLTDSPIVVKFEDKKTSPTIKVENTNFSPKLERNDINYHLQKHPEISVVFQAVSSRNSNVVLVTESEYQSMKKEKLTLYFVVDEYGELVGFYVGELTVAIKGENGFFPYSLPIIF